MREGVGRKEGREEGRKGERKVEGRREERKGGRVEMKLKTEGGNIYILVLV